MDNNFKTHTSVIIPNDTMTRAQTYFNDINTDLEILKNNEIIVNQYIKT